MREQNLFDFAFNGCGWYSINPGARYTGARDARVVVLTLMDMLPEPNNVDYQAMIDETGSFLDERVFKAKEINWVLIPKGEFAPLQIVAWRYEDQDPETEQT